MKRCLFYFKSLLLSLCIIFHFGNAAHAEIVSQTIDVSAGADLTAFQDTSRALEFSFRESSSSDLVTIKINADAFRRGYFGVLPLPEVLPFTEPRTGCSIGFQVDQWTEGVSARYSDFSGYIEFTRNSVGTTVISGPGVDDPTLDIWFMGSVTYRYDKRPGTTHVVFKPSEFRFSCTMPTVECPVGMDCSVAPLTPGWISDFVPPPVPGGEPPPAEEVPPPVEEPGVPCPEVGCPSLGDPPPTGTTVPGPSHGTFGPTESPTNSSGGFGAFFEGGGCTMSYATTSSWASVIAMMVAFLLPLGALKIPKQG